MAGLLAARQRMEHQAVVKGKACPVSKPPRQRNILWKTSPNCAVAAGFRAGFPPVLRPFAMS